MGRTSRGDNKSKQQRQQAILRLIHQPTGDSVGVPELGGF